MAGVAKAAGAADPYLSKLREKGLIGGLRTIKSLVSFKLSREVIQGRALIRPLF